MDKIDISQENLPNLEMLPLKRSTASDIYTNPEEPQSEVKEVLKEKFIQKINLADEQTEENKDIKISSKILRIDILNQIQELHTKIYGEKMIGISKKNKTELKHILSALMEEAVKKVQTIEMSKACEIEEVPPIEGPHPANIMNLKKDVAVNALARFGLIAMQVTEKISKTYKPYGFVVKDWSKKFTDDERLLDELKQCIGDIYDENQWLETALDCYTRMYILLLSTFMMSIEKDNSNSIDGCQNSSTKRTYSYRYQSKNSNVSNTNLPNGKQSTTISEEQ